MSSRVFTPGLLDGRIVLVNGAAVAIAQEMEALGASVESCAALHDESGIDSFVEEVLERHGQIDTLVNAGGGEATDSDPTGVRSELEIPWLMTHAVATKAFIPGERGGKVINLTESAALENLTRVLSIEWARFDIRLTAIAAGDSGESAWLAAFLASPAGDYFSGAVLGGAMSSSR